MRRAWGIALLAGVVLVLTAPAAGATQRHLSMRAGKAAIERWARGDDSGTDRLYGCHRLSRSAIACTVRYAGASGPATFSDGTQPTIDLTDHMRATLRDSGHIQLWSQMFVI